MNAQLWRRCGSCKQPILTRARYYLCGISTCRKTVYCSMPCFDEHVPIFRHKDAWAEEKFAPSEPDELSSPQQPKMATARLVNTTATQKQELPHDILVVASKLKDYIRLKSGMNTSANVLERLSDMIRLQCDKAVDRAASDNRKTVMDRDFYF